MIGTAAGPHTYLELVRDFQSVVGNEAHAEFLEEEGLLPDMIGEAVGRGSSAIGLFHPLLGDRSIKMRRPAACRRGWKTSRAPSHSRPASTLFAWRLRRPTISAYPRCLRTPRASSTVCLITVITGLALVDTSKAAEAVQRMKAHIDLLVCVGFGIKTSKQVRTISASAGGVVVGT